MMTRFAQVVLLLALAVWIGTMVFHSLVVMPHIFRTLEREMAATLAQLLFPPYYSLGVACAVTAACACTYLAVRDGGLWRTASALSMVILVAQIYAAWRLQPEIARLRSVPEAHARFEALHRRAVAVNGLVLLGAAGLLAVVPAAIARR